MPSSLVIVTEILDSSATGVSWIDDSEKSTYATFSAYVVDETEKVKMERIMMSPVALLFFDILNAPLMKNSPASPDWTAGIKMKNKSVYDIQV